MGLPMLPQRFPVGAKYVVEGYGGEKGNLRLIARYVVLPGGQRINVPADIPSRYHRGRWLSGAAPILSDPRPRLIRKRRQKFWACPRSE